MVLHSPAQLLVAIRVLILFVPMFTGCQTWSGFGFGNPSRVPPPATGTYQPPVGYYNNNSAVSSNAADNGVVPPIAAGMATTNLTAGAFPANSVVSPNVALGSGVQTASFSQPASVRGNGKSMPASRGISDLESTHALPDNFSSDAFYSDSAESSMPAANPAAMNSIPASGGLSDSVPVEQPSLRWQQ